MKVYNQYAVLQIRKKTPKFKSVFFKPSSLFGPVMLFSKDSFKDPQNRCLEQNRFYLVPFKCSLHLSYTVIILHLRLERQADILNINN